MTIARRILPAALFAMLALPGAAFGANDYADCASDDMLLRIESCGRLISSTSISKDTRAYAHNNRGMARVNLGDPDRGIEDFAQAVALDPAFEMAHLNLGHVYIMGGRLQKAKAAFEALMTVKPRSSEAYIGRALVYFLKQSPDECIADLNKAIEIDPTNALAYLNRGSAYRMKGDNRNAIQDFRKALELDPYDMDAHENLEELLRETMPERSAGLVRHEVRQPAYRRRLCTRRYRQHADSIKTLMLRQTVRC